MTEFGDARGRGSSSYLTLPADEPAARPRAPLPMVLIVHGGPWGRDIYG
jgi:acylaminoacyl-peptidase